MVDILQRPELLSTLLAGMLDGLSILDTNGTQVYVNDALCKMLGFEREELLGKSAPHPYWPAEELAAIDAAFQRTLRGDVTNFELVFRRKDDTRIPVIVAPAELRDAQGKLVAYFATVKDISEHKRLERSLLESEQRWRSVAENPFDFVVLIDREYRYTYVNHTAPGISRESLIGHATPFDFVDAEHHATMRAAFDTTFESGRATSFEVQVPQLDAWYSSIVGAVVERGRVTGLSILTRDITEQKRAERHLERSEQRLRDAHRMETIGTLAGGMAHDLNNMLTPVLACADMARTDLPADHPVQEHLRGIALAGDRARKLVQRVLLFSRRQEPHKSTFDLRDCVREDSMLLRASMPAEITLVMHVCEQPLPVLADRAQLGQLLTNLATNAMQAMEGRGGTLTIVLQPELPEATHALLSVTDTGPGMDEETMRRAFDPFFTTKAIGAGTGLGLSIVHSVAREHGGETTVRSQLGQGTVFSVRLPLAPASAQPDGSSSLQQPQQPQPATTTALTTSVRVLLVDDESAIASVAREALTRAGHSVAAVTSSQQALELFARDPNAFDVVITDQSMPHMTGTTLVAELRALRPTIACLLMTGRGDDATRELAQSLGVVEVIDKPFSLATLIAAVEGAWKR